MLNGTASLPLLSSVSTSSKNQILRNSSSEVSEHKVSSTSNSRSDRSGPSISSLPPNVTIRAPTKATVPFLRRINSLLLPVSYPESFYRDILQKPESGILTRLAFYDDECVGGIRCRVETEDEFK